MQVKAFKTQDDVDAWLLRNPRRCPGALHFVVRNKTVISCGVQTNFTAITGRQDRTFKFQIPLQLAAEREIARSLIGGHKYCLNLLYYICFYLINRSAFFFFLFLFLISLLLEFQMQILAGLLGLRNLHTQERNFPLIWIQWDLHFSLQLPCLVLCFKWVLW